MCPLPFKVSKTEKAYTEHRKTLNSVDKWINNLEMNVRE